LLNLCPNVEDLFLARFWHQWFHNALSTYPNLASVKKFGWHHDYSPLPNPDPASWIGQFSTWPSLESLNLRMLSFMDGSRSSFAALSAPGTESAETPATEFTVNPQSKLKELKIMGNIIPAHSFVAGLTALRAPLETLEISSIALLGAGGIAQGLQVVGARLLELRIIDDGRIGAINKVHDKLLPKLSQLCPALERLILAHVPFPQTCFRLLPPKLKTLVVSSEGSLSADQVLEGLEETKGLFQDLCEVQWVVGKDAEGWEDDDVALFKTWGERHSIKVTVNRPPATEE